MAESRDLTAPAFCPLSPSCRPFSPISNERSRSTVHSWSSGGLAEQVNSLADASWRHMAVDFGMGCVEEGSDDDGGWVNTSDWT
jgi:hypothetical protein